MSANVRLHDLHDYQRAECRIRVVCSCRRVRVWDAQRMAQYWMLRGWSRQIGQLGRHLRCARCGERPASIGPSKEPAQDDPWPSTPWEWKQLHRQLRG